jgi:hypothetical protein
MRRHLFIALFLVSLLPLAMVRGYQADEKEKVAEAEEFKGIITPNLERCTLEIEGRSLKPLSVSLPNFAGHIFKDARIQIQGATVRAFKTGDAKQLWEAKSTEEKQLAWLAADDKVIYLAGPLRVRRLETATGKWLDDLILNERPEAKENESIISALANGTHVIVLTAKADDKGQLDFFQVHSFKAGETKPIWSSKFQSAGKTASPGAFLLAAARPPAKAQPDAQPLSWFGDAVLVCAGPVQDLLCIDAATGKQRWTVERVWEFERGFIGPSVWQHFFSRRGRDGDEKKGDNKEKADKQPDRQNLIVGGPVVVDLPRKDRGKGDQRIFIAVAKGPLNWGDYLADCVVYELNSEGKPLAMVNVPRMVKGRQYQVQKDGVVWACQGGAFIKVGVSRQNEQLIAMGPGGPDLLCRVDWYRHLSTEDRGAWLTSDPAGEPVAFGKELAFYVINGGYVTKPDAGVYSFPLSMIDLKTGVEQSLILNVPFTGKIPEPKSNCTIMHTEDGKDRFRVMGPYVMALTWLQVEGNRLRITLGMEKGARSVDFDLGELESKKQK